MFIKLIFISLFVFSYALKANEVTVIDLHKKKSLDQLVLENEINIINLDSTENTDSSDSENNISEVTDNSEDNNLKDIQNESNETINSENETKSENTNLGVVTLFRLYKGEPKEYSFGTSQGKPVI